MSNKADYFGQFIVCRDEGLIPATWTKRSLGAWRLGVHPALPAAAMVTADGMKAGWLLGHAVAPDGRLAADEFRLPIEAAGLDGEQMESFLYEHGGRYVAIVAAENLERVYLDPMGSLATVYSCGGRAAASTAGLIPYEGEPDERWDLIETLHAPQEDTFFPFGLMPRRSVRRLLPNHYLDLRDWRVERHWPQREIAPVRAIGEAVREIVGLLCRNISAVADRHELIMSLTAGRDSRMLLSCARAHVERTLFVTFGGKRMCVNLDTEVAPKIAKRYRLRYRFLPYQDPSEEEVAEWMERTGHCVTGPQWIHTYNRLDRASAVLMGAGGEVGRGFHWRKGHTETSRIEPEELLEKRRIVVTPETLAEARQWLERVPIENTLTNWGLMYNEQFNGCWFGPLLYGFNSNAAYMCPFSHRRIFELMMGLPTAYRLENRLPEDIIRMQWPELLAIPFNWPMGFRRYWQAVKRRLNIGGRKRRA